MYECMYDVGDWVAAVMGIIKGSVICYCDMYMVYSRHSSGWFVRELNLSTWILFCPVLLLGLYVYLVTWGRLI